jgi:predicted ATPase/DNA-binding XRE family transcriptional regulator
VGLTQEELAERAGLSRRGIADLERGARLAPHAHTVERLAAALGLSDVERGTLVAAGRSHGSERASAADSPPPDMFAPDQSPFVGRAVELDRLRAACDRAFGGRGACVLIDGELGLGKTALCEQFSRYARARGIRTVIERCYEEPGLAPPFAEGKPTDQPRNEPAIIVLEDLQWADRSTLDVFRHLARHIDGTRLLLVGTCRDAEINRRSALSNMVDELRRRTEFVQISLHGLSKQEVRSYAIALSGRNVTEVAAEALREQTQGNPLFVREITQFLIDHDLELTCPEVVTDVLPNGLRDVLRRSVASLSGDCKEFLAIASMIGRVFETEIAAEVADFDGQQVRMALEEAQRAHVVEDIGAPRGMCFRFVHVLLRQTLCEELLVPRRLQIQQRVAHACQRREVKARAQRAAEISEQFAKTSDAAGLAVLSLSAQVRRYG